MAISSSVGLGSGLNIGDIVSVLVKADTDPKANQISRQKANNEAYISGVSSLRSALDAFTAAMKKLNNKSTPSFNGYAATSASDAVVKVTAGNAAVAGTYNVEVKNLATSSKVASQSFAGADTAIPEGDLTIGVGANTYTIKVGSGATLATVRDQINTELGVNGLSANIVNGKDGARLVLGSTATGLGNDIKVSGITELEIDGTQSMTGSINGAGYIEAPAKDASILIDGLEVTSSSNTIKDAVSGLPLELTGKSADGVATKVTVAQNNDGLKASVQSFVDAYNALQTAIASLTGTTKDEDGNTVLGSLTNDPTTRSLLGDVRKVLAEVGSGDRLTSLSQLGINTQKDGKLEFNSTKFTAAMNDKKLASEVEELFTGTNGIFERMNKAIDPYTATDGSLASRTTSLNNIKTNLDEQQAALDRRIDALTTSLTKQYVALDTALGKMQAQRDQITSIFEAINAQAKKS